MASIVDITLATEVDFPSLAHIQPAAMHDDPIHHFIFTDREDVLATKLTLDQLNGWAKDPNSHTFKATTKDTKIIVGYVNIRFEDYEEEKNEAAKPVLPESSPQEGSPQQNPPPADFPPGMNADFCKMYFGGKKAVHTQDMGGKKHFSKFWIFFHCSRHFVDRKHMHLLNVRCSLRVWVIVLTALMILPAYQRKGIGSELLRWILGNTELDKWPAWLAAQPKGRELYRKFGWEDVDNFDIDLSEWADPLSGYGLHRSALMIRPPGGGVSSITR